MTTASIVARSGLRDFRRISEGGEDGSCYYCLQDVPRSSIKAKHILDDCVLCPNCGIDSVVPKTITVTVNKDLLYQLYEWGFS